MTNMSVSSRISWTLGGGRAIASETMPSSGGDDFLVCENVYCGLSLHTSSSTCNTVSHVIKRVSFNASNYADFLIVKLLFLFSSNLLFLSSRVLLLQILNGHVFQKIFFRLYKLEILNITFVIAITPFCHTLIRRHIAYCTHEMDYVNTATRNLHEFSVCNRIRNRLLRIDWNTFLCTNFDYF